MLFLTMRVYHAPENEHAVIDVLNSLKGTLSTLTDYLAWLILSKLQWDDPVRRTDRLFG